MCVDGNMDDEIDFGDILPAPGGAANDHDDVLGAPEYHADPPSEERDPGGDRDGAAPKRVLVKIARRVGDDRSRAPSRDRGDRGSGGKKTVRVVVRRDRRSRSRSPPPSSGSRRLEERLEVPPKGKGKRPRDDGPASKEKRQKMELANAFCLICGAIGSHYTEGCPDRTHKERGKCMICGEAHALRDCPQKKVNPNKKEGRAHPRKRERSGKRIVSEKTSGGTKQERSPSPSPDGESKKGGRYAAYLEGGDRARSPDNKPAGWARGGDDGEVVVLDE